MYLPGKPYSRLLPPVFLSPIHESEEETQHPVSKSNSCIEELNNSSVIPGQVSETTCGSYSSLSLKNEAGGLSRKTDSVVIESCSGRKLEDVEVLKQKYINSEIQDLPRFTRGLIVDNGRIWRTRRSNKFLNLGSQDIRNQLNKLNQKTGASSEHADGETQVSYRCKKYLEANDNELERQKSLRQLPYPDDYDPELAALFENYVEKCDNAPKKHFSPYPTVSDARLKKTSFANKFLTPEEERVFLCGYVEGMRQKRESVDARDHVISADDTNMMKDVRSMASVRDLISNQQDVTHMSLRKWEHINGAENQQKDGKDQNLTKKSLTSDSRRSKKIHKNCDKLANLISAEGPGRDEQLEDFNHHKDDAKKSKTKGESYEKHSPAKETNLDVLRALIEGPLSLHQGNKYIQQILERTLSSTDMSEKSVTSYRYRMFPLESLRDKEESAIKLAKLKLEQTIMATHALGETYVKNLRTKTISNDLRIESIRKNKNESQENRTASSNAEAKGLPIGKIVLDELDGWQTQSKAFNDQDHVRVSSSEILHPVQSFQNFGSPYWSQSDSVTQSELPEHKTSTDADVQRTIGDNDAPVVSDMENNVVETKSNNNVFKRKQQGVEADYKKTAKCVKLRLTKSSDNDRDCNGPSGCKSIGNLPLSKCKYYSIEQNMRNRTMVATSINLSDKLAQQLKELSSDHKTDTAKQQDNKPFLPTEQNLDVKSEAQDAKLPKLSWCNSVVDNAKSNNLKEESVTCSLTDAETASATEDGANTCAVKPGETGKDENVSDISGLSSNRLPHLAVTSIPVKTSEEKRKRPLKVQKKDNGKLNKNAPVRARNCTSPNSLDKDGNKILQVKTKPLPPLYNVCTSCGGISKCNKKNDKQERKSKCNGKEPKGQVSHTRTCCGAYIEDKWKLDGRKNAGNLDPSQGGIKRYKESNSHNVFQHENMAKPQFVLSPIPVREMIEEKTLSLTDTDVNEENNGKNDIQSVGKVGEWLNSRSAPNCKDRYQCPVATETRIYKDHVKGNNSDQETTQKKLVASPYLDYCKIKAEMREKRIEQISDKRELVSDTDDVYMKAARKVKRFPVIPMKKSRECLKETKGQPRKTDAAKKGDKCDIFLESRQVTRSPGMKSSPYNISMENFNNNGQEHPRFYDSSLHF